jgi:toxin FitB
MILIDTNVLSELRRPGCHPAVRAWFEDTPAAVLRLSVITLGEIAKGVAKLPASRRRSGLERWLTTLRDGFAGRVLNVDGLIAERWGVLAAQAEQRGGKIEMSDVLIAATADVHGLRVATRNTSHITAAGAAALNPWTGQTYEPAS